MAEESEPISAVFDARVVLSRSADGQLPEVLAALRGLPEENALGAGCDAPDDWRALDLSPCIRACERLAALD